MTFKDRFNDLIKSNKTRMKEIGEIVQYSIVYIIVCLACGYTLDYFMNDVDETKTTLSIFIEITINSILISLFVFYIIKICHLIPPIFNIKNHTFSYNGDIIIAIIFFTTQDKINDKIDILYKRLFKD